MFGSFATIDGASCAAVRSSVKTLASVGDLSKAIELQEAALAAGMFARVDFSVERIRVIIDHPEARLSSVEQLVSVHGNIVPPAGFLDAGTAIDQLAVLDLATGIVAASRGLTIDDAKSWLRDTAVAEDVPVLVVAQNVIRQASPALRFPATRPPPR